MAWGVSLSLLAPPALGQPEAEAPAEEAPALPEDAPAPPEEGNATAQDVDTPEAEDPSTPDDGPSEENIAKARIHYERGKSYYKAGEFKIALIELRRAYAIAPSYRILFNIGQTQMQLRDYAGAYEAYAQYLEDGGEEVEEERQESVRLELGLLKNRTAFISVYSNTPGAQVRVDGIPIGKAPLIHAMINAGEHEVSVRAAGRSLSEYVALAGQEHARIHIDLPTETAPPPPPPGLPPIILPAPITPSKGPRTEVVVGWAVTGALAASAIGTGVAALFAQEDLRELKQTRTTESALDSASSKALGLSVTTDVLIGAAAIMTGVSLYFTLTDDDDEPASQVTIGPRGLWLQGHF